MHQSSVCKAVTLPDLPYAKNALEPTMCEETLDIHQYVVFSRLESRCSGKVDCRFPAEAVWI